MFTNDHSSSKEQPFEEDNFYFWIRDRSFRHSSNRFLYYVEEVAKLYNCFLDARQISTRPDKYIRIRGRRPLASSAFVSVFHGLIELSISSNSHIRSFSKQNGACTMRAHGEMEMTSNGSCEPHGSSLQVC